MLYHATVHSAKSLFYCYPWEVVSVLLTANFSSLTDMATVHGKHWSENEGCISKSHLYASIFLNAHVHIASNIMHLYPKFMLVFGL